jgi:hypothetical protein
MATLTYCWRTKEIVPMLDENEWQILSPHLKASILGIKEHRERFRSTVGEARVPGYGNAALNCYFELTGYKEANPENLWRYRRADYGSLCSVCGKPFRTPRAKQCAECGEIAQPHSTATPVGAADR